MGAEFFEDLFTGDKINQAARSVSDTVSGKVLTHLVTLLWVETFATFSVVPRCSVLHLLQIYIITND